MSEDGASAAGAEGGDGEFEGKLQPGFAGRRPGWDIPPLHDGLKLSSDQVLAELPSRGQCPKCERRRLYFCYDCLLPFTPTPPVQLPFNLYIVTHPAQSRANATGVHMAVLAPAQAHLVPLEEIPESVFTDPGTAVLYPDDTAVGAEDLARSDVPVTNVIVVDSLWSHSKAIMRDPKMAPVRHVRIRSYRTSFWRFHTKGVPSDGLCTVEAVYFLCKEMHSGAGVHPDCHCFDDLLWYFAFMHKKIYEESRGRLFEVRAPGLMTACKKKVAISREASSGRLSSGGGEGGSSVQVAVGGSLSGGAAPPAATIDADSAKR